MSKFLSENLVKFFTSPLLKRINELSTPLSPELLENIYSYLDPFPELIAMTYAIPVAIRYKNTPRPAWTDAKSVKPGITLYMKFSNFEGRHYLSSLDNIDSASGWSRMVQVDEELIVCRDHFAIVDIYSSGNQIHDYGTRRQSVFYYKINLRSIGTKQLKFRAFSDGRFLRALMPMIHPQPHMIEWNIPSLPQPGSTYWISKRYSALSPFHRCEYHTLSDLSGISAVIQGSKTIGLFCHQYGLQTSFKSFAAQLERTYSGIKLIFLYFPINEEEKIQAVAVRCIPDLRFPANTPVIQIATNKGRTYSFGPQPQNEDLFQYEALRSVADGSILGLFHYSTSNHLPALSDIGILTSSQCDRLQNLNISPGESLPCPSLGSPNQGWCFSKARLEINTTVQFCKNSETDGTCLGILLTYSNGSMEALGEIRFDKYLSENVNIQECVFSNQMIEGKLYVLIQSCSNHCVNWSIDEWHRFPIKGKLVWWCGWNGNQIGVLEEETLGSHLNT